MNSVPNLFFQLGFAGPLYLVWLVGIGLTLSRYHEAPARYRLVLIALLLFLVTGIVGTAAGALLPVQLLRNGAGPARVGLILSALGLVRTLIDVVGWVLLLLALFSRRSGGVPNAVK